MTSSLWSAAVDASLYELLIFVGDVELGMPILVFFSKGLHNGGHSVVLVGISTQAPAMLLIGKPCIAETLLVFLSQYQHVGLLGALWENANKAGLRDVVQLPDS